MKKSLKRQVFCFKHSKEGNVLIDYKHYRPERKELFLYGLESSSIVLIFAYFFYRSFYAVIPLLAVGIFFFERKRRDLGKKQKEILKIQFREMILSMSTGMRAGYSAENAIRESCKDMARMFGDKSLIYRELIYLQGGMKNNIPVEVLLLNFGVRSGVDEISEFGEIFAISKKSGGNLSQIIEETVDIISKKFEVDREIETLISAKKLEQSIMNLVPFLILFYVDVTSTGFFNVLYHNIAGNIIMTIGIAVYIAAICIEDKILNICI